MPIRNPEKQNVIRKPEKIKTTRFICRPSHLSYGAGDRFHVHFSVPLRQTPESRGHLVPVAAESPRRQREERTLALRPELGILLAHDFLINSRVFLICI
jgi:hypothetical protein